MNLSLAEEIQAARKKVVTDGYDMSLGEILNLYRDEELKIDPIFQRLFRWDDERKTRFIESVILGIPIPSIFVSQKDDGVWELVDGLQRISTVLQLAGELKGEVAEDLGPLVLNGTRFLPSLDGKRWKESAPEAGDGLGQALQIEIKRTRVRVEILKAESDTTAKFELFQRLNTGGVGLSEQEVRNSMAVSINRPFYDWLIALSSDDNFVATTRQTETALKAQAGVELVLRFLAFRSVPYQSGLDVHEYLDQALITMASDDTFDRNAKGAEFTLAFQYINDALGSDAFKRWNGATFGGKFLMSVFEVISKGISENLAALRLMPDQQRSAFIVQAAKDLWSNQTFSQNSGAGVRGTTRLTRLLPLAPELLKP
ncbi:DUF262 domain-containing protein [Rhizobium tumorigenes]|uniref:DUF262 domain-containing protein n=1 Tax=Rhizobium tumorigenes TaxID=2041385 RepID=UPI00241F5B8D|nr:DUF262 domain-containing protein [Rhizobium tumorigenes]WFR99589.1 DUF262 domain-containing protein [Rhizobium tumorigenes]